VFLFNIIVLPHTAEVILSVDDIQRVAKGQKILSFKFSKYRKQATENYFCDLGKGPHCTCCTRTQEDKQ